jgi:hypothetical protein
VYHIRYMIIFNNILCSLVQISDFGKDPDDTYSLLNGEKIDTYIATLHPSEMRARLAKGLLKTLRRGETPVYIGKNPGKNKIKVADYEFRFDISKPDEVIKHKFPLMQILNDSRPTVIVVNAAMTDLAYFFKKNYSPRKHKIEAIIMQGGYIKGGKVISPNFAANNAYDMKSAKYCFSFIQRHSIPFYIITKEFAYEFPISEAFSSLPSHPVSKYLESVYLEGLEETYKLSLFPPKDPRREGFPDDRDIDWFFKHIVKTDTPKTLPLSIGSLITKINVYDVFSTLFAQYPENFVVKKIEVESLVYEIKPKSDIAYEAWILTHSKKMIDQSR